ncbi:unnamed protein product [Blepharisma stoltei]|uniref:Uncharacterized protein n=1 Tax=Blepharisma stoltei TaxID=1481888 RepID=A0AAU9I8V2_9CILI|nr:unnamed protein product [Blepharisma stoltei]
MLGNLECDDACNNKDCNWDYGDCGCADGCALSDFGNCKAECLVGKCAYDQISSDSSRRCNNKGLVLLDLYQNLVKGSFDSAPNYFWCIYNSRTYNSDTDEWSTCDVTKAYDFTNCNQICDIADCAYNWINCEPEKSYKCKDDDCISCYGTDEGKCFKCSDSTVQLFGYCAEICPYGYEAKSIMGSNPICLPLVDISTPRNPYVYYASSKKHGDVTGGEGTLESPFETFAVALALIQRKYSILYLINDGDYEWAPVDEFYFVNNFIKNSRSPLAHHNSGDTGTMVYIKIASLDGSIIKIKTIPDKSNIYIGLWSGLTLEIENVIFDGTLITTSCSSLIYCSYCPYIEKQIDGSYKTDRGQKIKTSEYLSSTFCSTYNQNYLFGVSNQAILNLTNVTFSNWGTLYYALIESWGGNITLNNVNFDNIVIFSDEAAAVISMQDCDNAFYNCGTLNYTNGKVSRINNGFEYADPIDFRGFLYAEKIQYATFTNVIFEKNLVALQQSSTFETGSLITLKIFRNLEINNCQFISNIADTGIISIASKGLNFVIAVNENNELIDLLQDHIYIHNSTFTGNFGKFYGILYASFKGQLQNFRFENLSITSNGVESGSLIYVINNEIKAEYELDTTKPATLTTGQRVTAFYKARWFITKCINFFENYSGGSGMIDINNLVNIDVNSLSLDSNGASTDIDVNDIILNDWIEDSTMYLKLQYDDAALIDCASMISVDSSINISISDFSMTNNYCKESSPVFILSKIGELSISRFNCTKNEGNGDHPICLYVAAAIETSIINSTFISNANNLSSGSGAIGTITSNLNLTLENCLFQSNSAGYGGALYFQGRYLNISKSIFIMNKSPNELGGAIYYSPQIIYKNSGFFIDSCNFNKNQAISYGGAIYIEEKIIGSTKIDLQFKNVSFFYNSAENGAAIYIEKTAALSQYSSIEDSHFLNNTAETSGTLSISFYNGILSITDTDFSKNYAKWGSAIYITTKEDGSSLRSQTILDTCTITNNSGESIIHMDDLSQYSYLETTNCLFEWNLGTVILLNYDNWVETASIFRYNTAIKGGSSVSLQNQATGESTGTIFYENISKATGGAASISSQSIFKCSFCNFTNNYAENSGGVIYVEQNSLILIEDSIITGNSCLRKGSVMYLLGTSLVSSQIIRTNIYNNKASEGAIVLLDASILINSSKIHENSADEASPGLILTLSSANISSSQFYSQPSKQGCFIYSSTQSSLYISNSTFKDAVSSGSGGAIFAISTSITALNCVFSNLQANSGGAILAYSDSSLFIQSSNFTHLTSYSTGAVFDLYQSNVTILNSFFENFSSTGIYGDKLGNLYVTGSSFNSANGVNGGAIYCIACSDIAIKTSRFVNCNATLGGAVHLITSSDSMINSVYIVDETYFINNTALNGGAVYANNILLNLTNSFIYHNHAYVSDSDQANTKIQYGIGGGLFLNCKDLDICKFYLINNYFRGNAASYNGGAYAWDDIMPISIDNIFLNNSAAYAPNVASYPISMVAESSNSSLRRLESRSLGAPPIIANLENVASGQTYTTPLIIALIDHDGNVVKTDNTSTAELQTIDNKTTVSGLIRVVAVEGIYTFSSFTLTGYPGVNTKILVYTSAIDTSKSTKAKDDAEYHQIMLINVTFRLCQIGEATVGNLCKICGSNYYSLDPSIPECLTCPDDAICYGNYTMVPKRGYWRDNMYASVFWKCPNSDACLGSPDAENISYTGECDKGYKGNMCQSCEYGYSKTADETCSPCPDESSNSLRIAGVSISLIIICAIMVNSTRRSAFKPTSLASIYIKIFMNYLQLVMLVTTFNLKWPSLVWKVFAIQNTAGSANDQIFSFDCFLQIKDEPDQYYYSKLILMSLAPLVIALVSLTVWILIYTKRKNLRHFRNDYISTCVILLFLIHPNIVKMMFGAFSCKQINSGERWLTVDYDIRCWDSKHIFYLCLVVIPSIILWGIGIPALCLLNLVKNRRKLNEIGPRLMFGFFFNGYKKSCYYWEFIILYRKILVICCSVFLANISVSVQALTVTIILAASLHLHYTNSPYSGPALNELELRSIFVSATTIYCGLYFLTDSLDEISRFIFFLIIVFSNIYFLYYWLFKLIDTGLRNLQKRIPFLKHKWYKNDGYDDKLFENPKKGHIVTKEGEEFYSIVHSIPKKKDSKDVFDPRLTMADVFISMIPEALEYDESLESISLNRGLESISSKNSMFDVELPTSAERSKEKERHLPLTDGEEEEKLESLDATLEQEMIELKVD